VRSDHGSGLLFLEDGNIISAEYGSLTKEDAAHSIIVLENCLVEIRYYNRLRKRELHQNAVSLIMEALRLQDEKRDLQELQEKKNKTRLDLKKFTPASHSIDAEIGAKLKLDFNDCDGSLTSNLIGIVPDKHIIISVPSASSDTINVLVEGNEVLVRYMNLGKLCLFKTHIQNIITSPTSLLFLEFPSVIFYHELRKEKRTKIFLPSVLRADRDDEFYSVITDLSIMGCLCEIKAKLNSPFPELNIGDSVLINCLLPGLDEKETVEGVVRNIKKTPDQLRLGIQFDKPTERVTKSINNYLNILQNVA
jgi:hypothetical protein